MDDDHYKLMFDGYAKEERKTSNGLYANKIVERIVIGSLATAGVTVVGLAVTALWHLAAFSLQYHP